MQQKKLLIVYDVSYPFIEGGGQRRLWEVAIRLSKMEFKIDWICFQTWSGANVKTVNGIRYIGLRGFKGLYSSNGKRRPLEPIEFVYALLKNRKKLLGYDFVWSGQWPMIHLLWWMLKPSAISKSKLIVDWWEVWGKTWFKYSKILGLIGYLLEKFLLILLCKDSRLVLLTNISFNRIKNKKLLKNISIIPNGVDLKLFGNSEEEKVFDIVYFGRLQKHKMVNLLLQAVSKIKQTHDLCLNAIIIGDGPEYKKLKLLTSKLGIQSHVKFFDKIKSNNKVYSLLKKSRVFVNPSIKEGGASITTIEAYAAGLPVIAFECDDGIDPDIILGSGAGLFVEEINSNFLAEKILFLLQNKKQMKVMSNKAKTFSKKFDWDFIAHQYKSIFTG